MGTTSLEFSLLYFSTGEGGGEGPRYRLVTDGARFADRHGFEAVWLPERHFTAVGSLFPNPAVLHAALARETSRVHLRAGSVVLPLHHPLRVAEEWAVVDNLSGGRVGVAFASGWHPDDFAFFPEKYAGRQEAMFDDIETVRRLWRGERARIRSGDGREREVRAYPSPVQPELPIWVTAAGNPATFERAGAIGANLLTHMFNQGIEQTADKIALYRRARARHGHAGPGRVTVMLHAFLGESEEAVRAQVRGPFGAYLRGSSDVLRAIATSKGMQVDVERLTERDREAFLDFVLERMLDERVLFGTPEKLLGFSRRLAEMGVDEIACQIDFGVPDDAVLENLPHLARLRDACAREIRVERREDRASLPTPTRTSSLQDALSRCVEASLDEAVPGEERGPVRVDRLLRGTGEAVGRLVAAGASPRGLADLLDAAARVLDLAAATPRGNPAPSAVRVLRAPVPLPGLLWAHAALGGAPGEGDVRLFDESGAPVGELLGLRLARGAEPAAEKPPAAGEASASGTLRDRVLRAEAGARRSLLTEALREEVGRALKLLPDAIDPNDSLSRLGLDSLMAIDLKNRLESGFGVTVPVATLLEGPSVADLAAHLADGLESVAPLAPIPQVSGEGDLPVSFSQQRLWFLDRLEPGGSAYNIPVAVRLRGSFDPQAMERAIEVVVARHEALRTTIVEREGRPVTEIADRIAVPLARVDVAGLSPEEREVELRRHLAVHARSPFDLARGPLLRAAVIRTASDEHVLALTVHHVVADGWSMGVLVRELGIAYAALVSGRPPELPLLPLRYVDFAAWQRAEQDAGAGEDDVAYWRERLADAPALLELPTDRPRPATQTLEGATHTITIPEEVVENLRDLCRRAGVTLFTALLAGFKALLARLSGQDDVVVGSPVAGRNRAELEGLVGFFAQTLVLRTKLSGDPTFLDLLERVHETALGAYAHGSVPFERLVELLEPARTLSYSPIFQVMFLQVTPTPPLDLPELTAEPVEVDAGAARFDITLSVAEGERRVSASFEYNTSLFDAATMGRIADGYAALLASAAARPETRLSRLAWVPGRQRDLQLVVWNATATAQPPRQAAHLLFEEQARRSPASVAVVCGSEWLDYAELDARSSALAERLRSEGVGPETPVGVCLPRSVDMVVALLAVLKAGGAYVPLDPSYPRERLDGMLADCGAPLLLTSAGLGAVSPKPGLRTIVPAQLDLDPRKAPREKTDEPDPSRLAYVIYTSGSTGRPKGVAVTHGALANLLWSMRDRPGLGPGDVLVSLTSLSFDIAALEVFLPLVVGARLIVASRAEASDGARLLELLAEVGATVVQATPSSWRLLLEAGWQPEQPLRVLCGGEPLTSALAARLLPRATALWNLYGPTETTIWSTAEPVSDAGRITIGRPIANTTAYVLDRNLEPVPVGIPGDLYLGGAGLARGYVARPDLTAERFLPDPFAGAPGSRMYATGDRARLLEDGRIEHLGRSDAQIKLRGHRVELGEIEATLAEHHGVRHAAVRLVFEAEGEARLAAFVVAERKPAPSAGDLRAFLKSRLPEYMVPATFELLERLPLTSSGKLDRRALPAPGAAPLASSRGFVAPRTPLEALLAHVWAGVLGLERVGVHDGFFELGGHSLLAMQVVARVRSLLGVELSLRAAFETPTVADLAALLEASGSVGARALTEARARLEGGGPTAPEAEPSGLARAMCEDARLPEGFDPAFLGPPAGPCRHVLLTGATGFLGTFLLSELLRRTQASVTCLVRAPSASEGLRRVAAGLARFGLEAAGFEARVRVLPGDLEEPGLGLPGATLEELASSVDAIFHNGALVNHVYPYAALRPANVLGTLEVLRLARAGRAKVLHYVSTASVFSDAYAGGEPVPEEASPEEAEELDSGYTQSKWVAERLVLSARARGLPVCVYRPAFVSGDSASGLWPPDIASSLIRGCVELGAAPDLEGFFDALPVDRVAASIVVLSQRSASLGKNFHLVRTEEPVAWSSIVRAIRAFGYPLAERPYAEWLAAARSASRAGSRTALANVLTALPKPHADLPPGARTPLPRVLFECSNFVEGVKEAGLEGPPVESLLPRYLAAFVRTGALPPPSEASVIA